MAMKVMFRQIEMENRKEHVDSNVGLYTNACKKCKANQLCAGTYRTAFELFGDSIVKPYV